MFHNLHLIFTPFFYFTFLLLFVQYEIIFHISYEINLESNDLRGLICEVLRTHYNPNNFL